MYTSGKVDELIDNNKRMNLDLELRLFQANVYDETKGNEYRKERT